jgi:hypothetical protein
MKISPKLSLFFAILSVLNLISFQAKAVNGTSRITIARPITITPANEMRFGVIAPSTTVTGTVNTATGVVDTNLTHLSGVIQSGTFDITGQPNSNYSLTIPALVSLTGPGIAMTATLSTDAGPRTFDASGNNALTVHGILTVGINQLAGDYVGTYAVTANY